MIELEPIGIVRSPRDVPLDDDWAAITATIELDGERFTAEALRGLEEFSHVEVLYVFDRVDPSKIQTSARRPRGEARWPEVGNLRAARQGPPEPNRGLRVPPARR